MGCGESKHAVATANTISQSNRSNSKKINGSENKTSIKEVTDDVKSNTNASLEEQEKGQNVIDKEGENVNKVSEGVNVDESENPKAENEDVNGKAENGKENDHQENVESVSVETAKENEIKETAVAADVTEVTSEKKELKEENTEKSSIKEEGGAVPADSPHHFFSPKRGEDTIESIISDGVSGNSEYNTPRAKRGPSEIKADAPEEKESTTEAKNEEALKENEETKNKEGEAALQTTSETEDLAKTGEDKAPAAAAAEEESVTESSTKDPKTN